MLNYKEIKEQNDKLELVLLKDREDWGTKLKPLIDMIKDITRVSEAQVIMLSYRHQLTDKISEFQNRLYKKGASFDYHFKESFLYYSSEYNLKLSGGEKEKFIKSDLRELKRQEYMLESHIEFYYGCIKTLDQMAWAIKNKIHVTTEQL